MGEYCNTGGDDCLHDRLCGQACQDDLGSHLGEGVEALDGNPWCGEIGDEPDSECLHPGEEQEQQSAPSEADCRPGVDDDAAQQQGRPQPDSYPPSECQGVLRSGQVGEVLDRENDRVGKSDCPQLGCEGRVERREMIEGCLLDARSVDRHSRGAAILEHGPVEAFEHIGVCIHEEWIEQGLLHCLGDQLAVGDPEAELSRHVVEQEGGEVLPHRRLAEDRRRHLAYPCRFGDLAVEPPRDEAHVRDDGTREEECRCCKATEHVFAIGPDGVEVEGSASEGRPATLRPMDPIARSGGSSRFRLFALLVVAATAVVVVGIVLAGSGGDDAAVSESSTTVSDTVERSSETEGTAADESSRRAQLQEAVDELSSEVEGLRGLPFLAPVTATFLDEDAFRARLSRQLDEDLEAGEIAEVEAVWRALGLVDRRVDLEAVLRRALGEGVLGFYDPETDELVLRGVVLDEFVRSTLVHELTHALDDQHFDLDRVELMDGDDSEAQFGFIGLVEGTASWVEDQWVAGLDPDALAELGAAEARFAAGMDFSGLPNTLLVDLSLPYVVGPAFVAALVDAGGTDGIDAAYLDPPTTGEQLFEPGAYFDGEGAVPVETPPADGPVVVEGVIGASGFYEMLLVGDPARAGDAARDWGGDRYVAWSDGERDCVRIDVAADGPDALERLRSSLERYAAVHGDARVTDVDGLVRVTACG